MERGLQEHEAGIRPKLWLRKSTSPLKNITWRCSLVVLDTVAPWLSHSRSIEKSIRIQQNELDRPWRTCSTLTLKKGKKNNPRHSSGTGTAQKTTLEQGSPTASKPHFLKSPPFPVQEVTKRFASHPLNYQQYFYLNRSGQILPVRSDCPASRFFLRCLSGPCL